MSDFKERLIREFKDSYENSYQAFNKFVEDKIIENHGVYIMDKIGLSKLLAGTKLYVPVHEM